VSLTTIILIAIAYAVIGGIIEGLWRRNHR